MHPNSHLCTHHAMRNVNKADPRRPNGNKYNILLRDARRHRCYEEATMGERGGEVEVMARVLSQRWDPTPKKRSQPATLSSAFDFEYFGLLNPPYDFQYSAPLFEQVLSISRSV